MSLVPMGGNKIAPNPTLVDTYPDVYLTTGPGRREPRARGGRSRARSRTPSRCAATSARSRRSTRGRFDDEIVAMPVANGSGSGEVTARRRAAARHVVRGAREAAARVSREGHGDGRQLVADQRRRRGGRRHERRRARELGLAPLGRFVAFATAGVEPERFGIGPVPAVRKVLEQAGLTLDQIDLVELNEAFAAQVLACLRELPIDPDRLNVNGGAIALGHPLGCTGAKLTTTLLHEMRRRRARYGLVTMCVGGGMGAAGIFERLLTVRVPELASVPSAGRALRTERRGTRMADRAPRTADADRGDSNQ